MHHDRCLHVEYLPPPAFKPDPLNPRRHSRRQIKLLARSLKRFGFLAPILIDATGNILAGHGRLEAAIEAGFTEIPAIRVEHLSAAEARAFQIADNRFSELSSWDDDALAGLLRDLSLADLEFNPEDIGFTIGEMDVRLESLAPRANKNDETEEDIPPGPAVTSLGDLWHLGRHRILCGDALEKLSYDRLMGESAAALVFTDPPYNVKIQGHVSGKGAIKHREFAMATGEMSSGQFIHFLTSVLFQLARVSTKGSVHYICMDWRHAEELLAAGGQVYRSLLNLCIWVKSNAGMGSFYRSQHELVFVFRNGNAPHRNNVQLGQFGRNRTNVWEYQSINSFGRSGEEGNLLALHPTVKPVALVADAILDASARGDIVLDAFLGSGSTLIAAERVGRICHGMELDPLYVDTAIRRWQRHSGEKAIHAETGLTFDEMEARHGR